MQEWWRPDRFAARRGRLDQRGRIIDAVRSFFAAQGYVEVDTPALQVSPGLEPHLRAFKTPFHDPHDRAAQRYLHTSPEFAMLEWYRLGATYRDLMDECTALIRTCQQAAGAQAFTWRGHTADALRPWQRLSVAEAFEKHCRIDLLATAPDPLAPDLARLAAAAAHLGITPHAGDDWEALYFRIFLEQIEPVLGRGAPTILYDYPLSMAALSRRSPADPRLAERFEVYVCGLELANAFGELTDAAEQRRRFIADQAKKQALYGETYPIDEDFLAALEHGLPECAGVALGFDRLVMLATGAEDIEDVLWAPVR